MVAPYDTPPPEDDPMGPPKVSVEVGCIHCGIVYMSDEIRWKPDPDGPGGGWWVCPVKRCDGAGFSIDIFPTDPEVARQFGIEYVDDPDEDDDEYDDDEELLGDFEALNEPDTDEPELPKRLPKERPFFEDDEDLPF